MQKFNVHYKLSWGWMGWPQNCKNTDCCRVFWGLSARVSKLIFVCATKCRKLGDFIKLNSREICCVLHQQVFHSPDATRKALTLSIINCKIVEATRVIIILLAVSLADIRRLSATWSFSKLFRNSQLERKKLFESLKQFCENYKCVTVKTPILRLRAYKQNNKLLLITPQQHEQKRGRKYFPGNSRR